jgi:hypothetical protein
MNGELVIAFAVGGMVSAAAIVLAMCLSAKRADEWLAAHQPTDMTALDTPENGSWKAETKPAAGRLAMVLRKL